MREGPPILLRHSIKDLIRELPNIREGTEEGFHQGRVAIRRTREALAVVARQYDKQALSSLESTLSRAAKVLGRARDADVAQTVTQYVESRVEPSAAISRLRFVLEAEQLNARRQAIKEIESLGLDELRANRTLPFQQRAFFPRARWRPALRDHVMQRAAEVRTAIAHAGGVYFPNRVHTIRIAVKRLRYALELARATGIWQAPHAIRILKQVQSALGDAHDREVVIARLSDVQDSQTNRQDSMGAERFLRAEIQALHANYLKLRDDVLAVCDACDQIGSRGTSTRWLVLASLAVPSMIIAKRAATSAARQEEPVERLDRDALLERAR
jgi:CHAD domain-containing protein